MFNHLFLNNTQQEYKKEGLDWREDMIHDFSDTIDIVGSHPNGIFSVLEGTSNYHTIAQQVQERHPFKKHIFTTVHNTSFIIQHMGSKVCVCYYVFTFFYVFFCHT